MSRQSVLLLVAALFFSCFATAHPGSGIVIDKQGNLYFTDTGFGIWKVSTDGRLTKFHDNAFHWLAIDMDGCIRQGARSSYGRLLSPADPGGRHSYTDFFRRPASRHSCGPVVSRALQGARRSRDHRAKARRLDLGCGYHSG